MPGLTKITLQGSKKARSGSMANETMRMSAAGMAALRQREGAVLRYYNDAANHCTYGVGALAHHGPCTSEELRRPVNLVDVDIQLAARVRSAGEAVRLRVRSHPLTQAQFDALVSFTFNTGTGGARSVLDAANRGAIGEVVSHMNSNVYVHPRDSNGRRLAPVRLQGLINRRREETLPFQSRSPGR
jgi:lysozyme